MGFENISNTSLIIKKLNVKLHLKNMHFRLLVCFVGCHIVTGEVTLTVPAAGNCGDDTVLACQYTAASCTTWSFKKRGGIVSSYLSPATDKYTGYIDINQQTTGLIIRNMTISDADRYRCSCDFDESSDKELLYECKPTSVAEMITPDKLLTIFFDNVYPEPLSVTVLVYSSALYGAVICTEFLSSHYNCIWTSSSSLEDVDDLYFVAITTITQTVLSGRIKKVKPRGVLVAVAQTNTPIAGETITLGCSAWNYGAAPNVTWTYRGQSLSPYVQSNLDPVTETYNVVSMLQRQVTAADNGEPATCHVNSIALTTELASTINIFVKFPVLPGSTVILGNRQIDATGSKILDLNCTTGSSNPASIITWLNGSTVIPNSNTVHSLTGENRGVVSSQILTLTPTPYNDGDVITCSVTNYDFYVAVSQGGVVTDSVTLKLTLFCYASENSGLLWKEGYPGRESRLNACPVGYSGFVSRYCGIDGVYHDPVYNCTNRNLLDIAGKDDLQKLSEVKKVVVEKNNSVTLYAGDLETINTILRDVTNAVTLNSTTRQNASYDFINIVNSVMEEELTETWTGIINNTGSGMETTIHTLDSFVEKLTMTLEEDEGAVEFAKSNLFLRFGNIKNCSSDLEFPHKTRSNAPIWAKSRTDSINIPCNMDAMGQKYSGSMYRNVSKYIPTHFADNTTHWTLNGPLLGLSLYSNFTSTVTISFQVYDKSLRNPQCTYWKILNSYTGAGNWSTDGCRLHRYSVEEGIVVCICDHLTNFAVLMSPADSTLIGEEHINALSIISMVGCIISMLCLAITVAVYIFFWRTLKTDRAQILIHLCLTLLAAHLIFLAGVSYTSNKAACTAVSVSLHYIFLVAFCLMLAQGIVLGTCVLLPYAKKKLACPLIIVAYVFPVVIVGISMALKQLDGYGNEKHCWLDVNTGLIWAFLAPVLFIILLNIIIIVVGITKMLGTTAMERKTNLEKIQAAFKGLCVLVPVMGVTWILGIFSVSSETVVFQYLFSVFNSLQGLLIMIFNCVLDKKVQMACRTFKTKGLSSGKRTADTDL